ncbi:MAG: HTTM domain-containing protein [Acidobacteria bacterium]|nr:HTTM domain-containing protein [Acidobacteriota bacterium]
MSALDLLLNHIDEKTQPQPIGLARIGLGLTAIMIALVTHRDILSLIEPGTLQLPVFSWVPLLNKTSLYFLTAFSLTVSFLFTVGAFARFAGFSIVALIVYRHLMDWSLYQNYTAMLALFILCASLGNPGSAISVSSRPPTLVPLWPQTLIKFQISVIYFYTALSKCNPLFLEGRVFKQSLTWLAPWDHSALWTACAIATIILEFALVICLWLPATRAWMIALGTAFHLGILFNFGFISSYIGFTVEFISIYLLYLQPKLGSLKVVWDEHCSFCRSWINSFRFLDWFGVLKLEGTSDAGLEILAFDGAHQYGGFRAIREILGVLPITLYFEPWLRIWPLPWLGDKVYKYVAARRHCKI